MNVTAPLGLGSERGEILYLFEGMTSSFIPFRECGPMIVTDCKSSFPVILPRLVSHLDRPGG